MADKAKAVQCVALQGEDDPRVLYHATFRGSELNAARSVRLACGAGVEPLGAVTSIKRRPTCRKCKAAVRRRR